MDMEIALLLVVLTVMNRPISTHFPNKIFTRSQLTDEIWGMFRETDERTVNTHINRLRDRFADYTDFDHYRPGLGI